MVKKLVLILVVFPTIFLNLSKAYATASNKYVVIVNPVREKTHWRDVNSVKKQMDIIDVNNVPRTWLLQYSVVKDRQTAEIFRDLNSNQEVGVLLEVNEELAFNSLVPYLKGSGDWARADKVLLSGYTPSERKRMIDKLFEEFNSFFGRYPKAAGAWYIDTDSLNYLVSKYKVESVLEVADQYQTDSYGVWGKPWGTPYIPSKYNTFLPAKGEEDKLDVVTIQWAARDPVLGYGLTIFDSTYSVQANDYINYHGLDINYFGSLAKFYLNSLNDINQLTIGLEAGQEGAVFFEELDRQIRYIKENIPEAAFLTMSDFANAFKSINSQGNPYFFIPGGMGYWFSTPYMRTGFIQEGSRFFLRDLRIYDSINFFPDIYEKDRQEILLREIPPCIDSLNLKNPRLIVDDLERIEFERISNGLKLILIKKNKEIETMELAQSNLFLDGRPLLREAKRESLKDRFIKSLLSHIFENEVSSDYFFRGGVRYSTLEGQSFLGLMTRHDLLLGVSSQFPYFGFFRLPFEVLSYFKTLPKINFLKILIQNFERQGRECTIDL